MGPGPCSLAHERPVSRVHERLGPRVPGRATARPPTTAARTATGLDVALRGALLRTCPSVFSSTWSISIVGLGSVAGGARGAAPALESALSGRHPPQGARPPVRAPPPPPPGAARGGAALKLERSRKELLDGRAPCGQRSAARRWSRRGRRTAGILGAAGEAARGLWPGALALTACGALLVSCWERVHSSSLSFFFIAS